MGRRRRAAVRVLSIGADHGGGGPSAAASAADGRTYRRCHERQSVPVRNVSTDSACNPPRGPTECEWRSAMNEILNLSRRRFVQSSLLAGGGLVLGFNSEEASA